MHLGGVVPEEDPCVEGFARVVLRVEEHGPLAFEKLVGWVIGIESKVVDDGDVALVEEVAEESRVKEREAVFFEPGVDVPFPAAVSRDAISRSGEPASRDGNPFSDGEESPDAGGIKADDLLGVLDLADLLHERIDDIEALTPGLVRGHTVECMLRVHGEIARVDH